MAVQLKVDSEQWTTVKTNEVYALEAKQALSIQFNYGTNWKLDRTEIELGANMYLIIDTRNLSDVNSEKILLDSLKPYKVENRPAASVQFGEEKIRHTPSIHSITAKLPYTGNIFVNTGDKVVPETLVGENKFDPPKVYVVMVAAMMEKAFTEDEFKEGMLVKINDTVAIGDKIFKAKNIQNFFKMNDTIYSPVRGVVESISYITGTVIMREIQDYPLKPAAINIAKALNIEGKSIKGYLKKRKGDFVYAGDTLAVDHSAKFKSIASPYTGTIQEIDTKKGTVKICYDKKPYQIYSQCYGTVDKVTENNEAVINIEAVKIEGKIGFGKDIGGNLVTIDAKDKCENIDGNIVYVNHVRYEDLMLFAEKSINGLVCNTISYSCLKKFLNKDIGVALTGNENIPFSLVILDGFISKTSDSLLQSEATQHNGKYTLLKPHTQIRAGATRPTVYIMGCHDSKERKE
jgi:biotin carboxyl carrier protein